MTAAHELSERGFDVTVYERRAWGGKARSTAVPGSAAGGRPPLPGEHGFRIFFGAYKNNPDTLRRIPFGSNPNGVFDNLVGVPHFALSRAGKRDIVLPINPRDPRAYTPLLIHETVLAAALQLNLPPDAAAYFAGRMVVYLSSCDARRHGQWDDTAWTTFIRADRWPGDYSDVLGKTWTHILQASRADETSAQMPASVLEWTVYGLLGLDTDGGGPSSGILNLPTNEALIDPWVAHLAGLGVRLRLGQSLTGLTMNGGRVAGARVRGPRGMRTITADWYVCALPVERARRLWTPAILAADPGLARMFELKTAWMNGIQFYLRNRPNLASGHIACLNSPWMVSGILQTQFWARSLQGYGDGRAADCFSAIVSNWNTPGVLFGKPARDCTTNEIAHEVWHQLKLHLNDSGRSPITDDLLLSWTLDPGLVRRPGGLISEDPLVLPSVGAWKHRPEVGSAIPNLVLAGDYPRGDWEVATMEAANSSGRGAANTVLQRAGAREPPVTVFAHYRPPEWEALKRIDAKRYERGQPNLLDTDLPLAQLTQLLGLH